MAIENTYVSHYQRVSYQILHWLRGFDHAPVPFCVPWASPASALRLRDRTSASKTWIMGKFTGNLWKPQYLLGKHMKKKTLFLQFLTIFNQSNDYFQHTNLVAYYAPSLTNPSWNGWQGFLLRFLYLWGPCTWHHIPIFFYIHHTIPIHHSHLVMKW